jgi:hypothetical protein
MKQQHQGRSVAPLQYDLFANHPISERRLRPANCNDPFASAPSPTHGVFNGVLDDRSHAKRKVVSLDLLDLAKRVGPANYDAHDKG